MKIVSDHENGDAQPVLQLLQKVHNFPLNGNVEPRCRFIGDNKARLKRDGSGRFILRA